MTLLKILLDFVSGGRRFNSRLESRSHKACGLGMLLLAAALPADAEIIAITGGKIYTMTDDRPLDGATVLIADGRIEAVGPDVHIPDGARVFDATGQIVTPGLVDANSHIGLVEVSLEDATVDAGVTAEHPYADRFSAAFFAPDGFNPASTLVPINRIEGITRAMVAPMANKTVIAGQGAMASLSGSPASLMDDSRALYAVLGESGAQLAGGARAAAQLHFRQALDEARDYAEHEKDYLEGERRPYFLNRLDLEALKPYVAGERPVVVTVHRASDIRNAVRLADELGLDLVIQGGAEAWRVADELAAARVPVILDPLLNLPVSFEALGATLENAARLQAAGVTVAFSTGSSHNARKLKQAAGVAVAHGIPWIEALRAITLNPARIFGMDDRVGTLAKGRIADVVVWSGDPLELTTTVEQVFIDGRPVPMESRQTRLRDRYLDIEALPQAYDKP